MFLLLGFSFLAGLATILAPCVWPILPVVLSSSAKEGRFRPLGVASGIVISFAFLTLTLSYLVRALGVDPNIFRYVAVIVLLALGASLIIPQLSAVLESAISRLTATFSSRLRLNSGLFSGLLTGLSLGVVWTPCAGPILGAIATLAGTGQVSATVTLMTMAYSIGAGVPLFVLALGGQALLSKTKFLSPYTIYLQKIFGVIIILTALAILSGYDKIISSRLLDAFPTLSTFSTSFETNQLVKNELNNLQNEKSSLNNSGSAPEFTGITHWINSPSLTLSNLHGKVVLVDFWTYTCINCLRTLPHLTAWYDKYKDSGLVIIGVHTPEFTFEKNTSNVQNALNQFNIKYPIAQDNDYATWNAYHNQYWPAEYLIDRNGIIRKEDFGEGKYDEMEQAIRNLIAAAGNKAPVGETNIADQTPTEQTNAETYLGSERSEYYYPSSTTPSGNNQNFALSSNLPLGAFSLGGRWNVLNDHLETVSNSTLRLKFHASKVYIVIRPPANAPGKVKVLIDGQVLTGLDTGVDVKNGEINVDRDRLYTIFDHQGSAVTHTLELQFENPSTQPFVFTFG